MLESVRHYERRPSIDKTRGRPRRWLREDVATVAEKMREILKRSTGGRIAPSSFISLYLPVLRYPKDVTYALSEGKINIREAAYLSRLTPERLKRPMREARMIRAEILAAHLLTSGSQSTLRRRVKNALGELHLEEAHPNKSGRKKADELLAENPYDARHLFYEEVQQLTDLMRRTEPDELKGKVLGEFLLQIDKLLNMLRRVRKPR